MKKLNKYLLLGATALSFGVAGMGTAVSATPNDKPEWGCGYGPGMDRMDKGQRADRMRQHMRQRHTELHDKLNLNAQQEAAWQTYTDATMKNMTPPSWSHEEMAKLTAPQRLEKMIQFTREREQKLTAQLDALKTFYATLTPEQQKIFDAEWAGRPRGKRAK